MATIEDLEKQIKDLKKGFEESLKQKSSIIVQSPPKVKKFSGDRKELTHWIADIERCISLQSLDDTRAVNYIMNNLEGRALTEIEFVPDDKRTTPKEIFDLLRKAFGELLEITHLEDFYHTRKQKTGESLEDFAYGLMDLIERIIKLNPTFTTNKDVTLCDKFANRVRDVALRRHLKDKIKTNPKLTFSEVRELAHSWQAEDNSGKAELITSEVEGAIACENVTQEGLSQDQGLQKQILELFAMQRKQQEQLETQQKLLCKLIDNKTTGKAENPVWRCYSCGDPGHLKRNCPKYKPNSNRAQISQLGIDHVNTQSQFQYFPSQPQNQVPNLHSMPPTSFQQPPPSFQPYNSQNSQQYRRTPTYQPVLNQHSQLNGTPQPHV